MTGGPYPRLIARPDADRFDPSPDVVLRYAKERGYDFAWRYAPVLRFDDPRFGGSVNNTPAENDAALARITDAVPADGRAILFFPLYDKGKSYRYGESTWNLRRRRNILIRGDMGWWTNGTEGSDLAPGLTYVGTGTSPAIDMTYGDVWWQDIKLDYESDSFTGSLLTTRENTETWDTDPPTNSRAGSLAMMNVYLGSTSPGGTNGVRSADELLQVQWLAYTPLFHVYFNGAQHGVRGTRTAHTAASADLKLPDQPTDGDTMRIDRKIYTFQTTLTNADGNIEIGANVAATQTNVKNALELGGTPGTGYAASMEIHPTIEPGTWSSDTLTLTAIRHGKPGNLYATTDTFTSVNNKFVQTGTGTATATLKGGLEPDWSISVVMYTCYFKNIEQWPILNPHLAWHLDGNTYEPIPNETGVTNAGMPRVLKNEDGHYFEGLSIDGMWISDVKDDGTNVFELRGDGLSVDGVFARIYGNTFALFHEQCNSVIFAGGNVNMQDDFGNDGVLFDFVNGDAGARCRLTTGFVSNIAARWESSTANDFFENGVAPKWALYHDYQDRGLTSVQSGRLTLEGAYVPSGRTLDVDGDVTVAEGLFVDDSLQIVDGMTAPSATTGRAKIFVDSADGDLKVIFGDGTTKTIVVDT